MTLVQALKECGPGVGDPAVDDVRGRASAMIYERLKILANRLRPDGSGEDSATIVAIRIIQKGPRGHRQNDPHSTDELVDAYLIRALRNARIDEVRRQRPCEAYCEGAPPASPYDDLEKGLELKRARGAILLAVDRLFGEILDGQRESVREAILARREVAEGRKSFDDCILEQSGEITTTTRNKFYQRQKRAVQRLGVITEAYILDRQLDPLEAGALRIVHCELKDANAGWPVDQGEN
jgi:hypothetical protein